MPAPLLLSVKDALVRYNDKVVFQGLDFNIHDNSRIALVGKNGVGKTTLMNIITGTQEMDDGERWEEPGITIGYLRQEIDTKENQSVFDYIFSEIKEGERELHAYKVDIVAEALSLDVNSQMAKLSGGELRRAGLARALVEEPKILLLDEPTNHLDLDAITWLEEYLSGYQGTLLCVSHDRAFLSNITNQVFWLDRGALKVSPRGFKYFDEWAEMLLEQEERELKNRRQIVNMEVEWASRGVKARRKRNVRRVEQMREMRARLEADEVSFKRATKKIELGEIKETDAYSKVVAEFYNVSKSFEDDGKRVDILDKFSMRIRRGDRIGILGKNGSGKTTLLKLLVGELEPDSGSIKRRKELEFSYFDQKRSALDEDNTLKKTLIPEGGDYINVMGKDRHVCGYLKDFMFDPSRTWDKVSTLSGGQKNRLMLAKVLANPKSCLILDEPTNDLDMETLDMLEEVLSEYKGTLIVVSHDRDFLDQTVTQILAFEGGGRVERRIGGYSDYLAWKNKQAGPDAKKKAPVREVKEKEKTEENKPAPQKKAAKKMSFKDKHELKKLPGKIEQAEAEIAELSEQLSDADFYRRDPDAFHEATRALGEAQARLERYETRWLELEEMGEDA